MQLFINDTLDYLHTVNVDCDTTIDQLKKSITSVCGVDYSIMKLTYAGETIQGGKGSVIWDSGIQPFDVINIEMSLAGQSTLRLVSCGIRTNSKTMILAARSTSVQSLSILQLLLDSGIDVDSRLEYGNETALIIASQSSNIEAVKILINHNCDVNLKTSSNRTALHYAVENDCYEIVKLLIEQCVDLYVTFPGGIPPLHKAILDGFNSIAELIYANVSDRKGAFELALQANEGRLMTFFTKEQLRCNLSHRDATVAGEVIIHPLATSIDPSDLLLPPSPDKIKRSAEGNLSLLKRSCYGDNSSRNGFTKSYNHPIHVLGAFMTPADERKRLSETTFSVDRLEMELKRSCIQPLCVY